MHRSLARPVFLISKQQAAEEGGNHDVFFTAQPVGGILQIQPEEVVEAAYFTLDQLPPHFFW